MSRTETVSHILAQGRQEAPLRLLKPEPDDLADELAPHDPRHYRAFTTGQKPPRLTIKCHSQPSRSPPYMALLDVVFDERFGETAALIFTHMVVTISGRNLAGVVAAICRHRAVVITEFGAGAFDALDGDAAVIERVEVNSGNDETVEQSTRLLP